MYVKYFYYLFFKLTGKKDVTPVLDKIEFIFGCNLKMINCIIPIDMMYSLNIVIPTFTRNHIIFKMV